MCGDVDFGEKPANIKRLKPINTTNKHYYRILFSLAMLVQNSILTHRNLETYSENLLPGFCLGTKICLENRVGGIGNREVKRELTEHTRNPSVCICVYLCVSVVDFSCSDCGQSPMRVLHRQFTPGDASRFMPGNPAHHSQSP